MANIPTRILRRVSGAAGAPATSELLNAQLAHNEVDDTIYIGKGLAGDGKTSTSVVAVAGKGAFVDKASEQTISGKKNFTAATVSTAPAASTDVIRKTDLDTEVSALQSAVTTEANRALAAEQALGVRIDNVLSNTDATALNSLSEVVTAFQAADSNLNNAITTLADAASTGLQTETDARVAADSGLDTRLTSAEGNITALQTTAAGLGTMSTQNANSVAVTGGTISGVTFTNATFTDLVIDSGTF